MFIFDRDADGGQLSFFFDGEYNAFLKLLHPATP